MFGEFDVSLDYNLVRRTQHRSFNIRSPKNPYVDLYIPRRKKKYLKTPPLNPPWRPNKQRFGFGFGFGQL